MDRPTARRVLTILWRELEAEKKPRAALIVLPKMRTRSEARRFHGMMSTLFVFEQRLHPETYGRWRLFVVSRNAETGAEAGVALVR